MTEKQKILKFSEVYEDEMSEGFYDTFDYVDIRDLKDCTVTIHDITPFESDKGPGVAVLFIGDDGKMQKTVTHSIGVTKALSSDAVMGAIGSGSAVEVTIRRKKSEKTGRDYFYLE